MNKLQIEDSTIIVNELRNKYVKIFQKFTRNEIFELFYLGIKIILPNKIINPLTKTLLNSF